MIASHKKLIGLVSALLLTIMMVAPAMAVAPAPGAFERTWARTDKPVADDVVDRTWIWGPEANTEVMEEPYADSPGGMRDVQYFDKSRMEINHPDAPDDGLWYVTNGLLVVELMTGNMQVGDDDFESHSPAEVNIAGDPGYEETPTYADYAGLMNSPAFAQGSAITATVDGDGNVGSDESRAEFNVTAGVLSPETGHRTASVFWDFMTSSGTVFEDDELVTDRLFENPYYATGLPITEAYWSQIMVAGSEQWVLTQAFERRVLTYTPTNNEGFQVEAGNVGLHYYQWRYETEPPPPPTEPESFSVMFGALNDSGVAGTAELTLDGDQLTVSIEASGLEADQMHVQHIHGMEDGSQAVCPTPDMAGDDGVLSLEEGLPAYGPPVVGLEEFPTADADGNVSFEETYTVDADMDLSAHVIALHGMTLGDEYDASLPVACGLIMPEGSFVSELSGANELPDPVESEGSGFANYVVTADGDIAYSLVVNGLTNVTAAHIHLENEGEDTGGVVVPLFGTEVEEGVASNGILASGIITQDDLVNALEGATIEDLLTAMDAGETYTNVHTVTNPAGELRGQIVMLGEEPPPPPPPVESDELHVMFGALNSSGVTGTATLTLSEGQVTVAVDASGVVADAEHMMHIHGFEDGQQSVCPTPDMAGDDGLLSLEDGLPAYGGVVIPLEPYPTADADGNISFEETYPFDGTAEDLALHTIAIHGLNVDDAYEASVPVACGIIMPDDSFTSELSGANELPDPVDSEGSGFAVYHMNEAGDAISFVLAVNGLTDVTAAHIHLEDVDADTGGVVVPLFGTDVEEGVASDGILASGVITQDDLVNALEGSTLEDLLAAMEAGETYTNVHTVTNPMGELRGQIEAHSSAPAGAHMH